MPNRNANRYILKGGADGSARLKVLAEALRPSTEDLLKQVGSLEGLRIIDAASGGGDASLRLAELAGPSGHVTGFDLDAAILNIASERAARKKVSNLRFMVADVTKPWLVENVDLIYARFILTHLASPEAMLTQAHHALRPGGHIVVEDVDADGVFSDPEHPAIERFVKIYVAVSKARGGDPFIGRRLHRLLADNGFAQIQTRMVHHYGRTGPAKISVALAGPAVADEAVALNLISREDMDALCQELLDFARNPETTISMPRVFQAWGTKA